MRYYIREVTYLIAPDGTQTICDETTDSINDSEGNALDTAEQRFYNKIADEMEFESENSTVKNQQNDYLYVQMWSLDAAFTMIALKVSITESQIRRNMSLGLSGIPTENDDEMFGASFLGEAVVQSQYSDVVFERERLWKRCDGVFVLETSQKFFIEHQISWDSDLTPLSLQEARTWGRKHLNPFQYNALFGTITDNDDRVPVGFMMRKDHKAKLQQRAKQEGKSLDELLNEALTGFLQ